MGIEGIVNGIKKLIEDKELRERLVVNTVKTDYGNHSEVNKLYKIINTVN